MKFTRDHIAPDLNFDNACGCLVKKYFAVKYFFYVVFFV